MSAVSEWVVREYFEQIGYLVNQPCKHVASGRPKTAAEEVDLVVFNPNVAEQKLPDHLVWSTGDLAGLNRAVVAVRGWHTDRIYAGMFEQTPEILRFVEPAAARFAGKLVGSGQLACILCVPRLPASGELKDKTINFLREKGVHGIIPFETMLGELVAGVEINRNYEKSDVLQVIRLLKIYHFLRDPQLEFLTHKARRTGRRAALKAAPETA